MKRQWKFMPPEQRIEFLNAFEGNQWGDAHISHPNRFIADIIERQVPFSLRTTEVGAEDRLVVVPEYSGPSTKPKDLASRQRIEASLAFMLICPDDIECNWTPTVGRRAE